MEENKKQEKPAEKEEEKKIIIATHSGNFHADDVFATAIIKLMHPEAEIIRTRNEEIIKKADYRVDVGFKNNPETNDFDHHQEEGAGTRDNGIPYASCGLVWKKYGKKICGNESAAKEIDETIIQTIDATDSGVEFPPIKNTEVIPYTISNVIELENLTWQERGSNDEAFLKVLETATKILKRAIEQAKAKEEAKKIVNEALEKSKGPIVELPFYCPWKHVITKTNKKLVMFPSKANIWVLYAVPIKENSFSHKILMPKEWAGKTGEELEKTSGIKGAIFCHKNRFMATAKTKEAIMKMAEKTLSINE